MRFETALVLIVALSCASCGGQEKPESAVFARPRAFSRLSVFQLVSLMEREPRATTRADYAIELSNREDKEVWSSISARHSQKFRSEDVLVATRGSRVPAARAYARKQAGSSNPNVRFVSYLSLAASNLPSEIEFVKKAIASDRVNASRLEWMDGKLRGRVQRSPK